MFKKYYLAYGSNLNLKQMTMRCPNAKPIGTINLKDHRLVYKGGENGYSYLTIEKCDGYNVPLGIYEVSFLDIISLDKYEGYPTFYSKYYIDIQIGDKLKKALIYIMNEQFDYHIPSREYINICMKGYEDFGFDKEILNQALYDTIDNLPKILKKEKNKKDKF